MRTCYLIVIVFLVLGSCSRSGNTDFEREIQNIELKNGDIALCGKEEYGTVDFDISCTEKARKKFKLATALLHSFEYEDAEKVFAQVIKEDPKCVMAYWGVAMSNYHALWAMNETLDLEKGWKVVSLARKIENKTEREYSYLEAIGAFYDDYKNQDHKSRSLKFEKAMEGLYLKYPNEKEAAIFYALSLNANADPMDKTYSRQRKASEILNKLYTNNPNHPGIAHYIIHTHDHPELAQDGLTAARRYASIAPASAHAQHMPSHIFTRLGLWDECITSNLKSIDAARCYAANMRMKGPWGEELHGMDYLVYAYLQNGEFDKAKEQVELLESYTEFPNFEAKGAYVLAAIPARYAIERKQWKEASNLEIKPHNFPWEKFPWEEGITHFVKLLGNANLDQLDKAGAELDKLIVLQKKLADANETYKANQLQIQVNAGKAWIHLAKGEKAEAIQWMTLAADMEDATGKHPITPGEVVPARELLGDLLMEAGEPALALEAYDANLKTHPNRLNGIKGREKALKAMKGNGVVKLE